MRRPLFMETTQIPAERTAHEIMTLLGSSGARQITIDYDGRGISGLSFALAVNDVILPYKLPVRIEPVFAVLSGRKRRRRVRSSTDRSLNPDRAQAERVAWRQLLRWIQAQVAMVEVDMVKAEEVFLPYMQRQDGRTLFECFTSTGFKELAAGAKP